MLSKLSTGNGLLIDVFKTLVIIDCTIVVDVVCYDIKNSSCLSKYTRKKLHFQALMFT